MNSCKVLKFADTNFKRTGRDVFEPYSGCIMLQTGSFVLCRYEYRWRGKKLPLQSLKITVEQASLFTIRINEGIRYGWEENSF